MEGKRIIPIKARQAIKAYEIQSASKGQQAQFITPNDLLIPCYGIDGELQGIQQITPHTKLTCGSLHNGLLWIGGGLSTGEVPNRVYIAEGWATAVDVHMLTRNPVLVAFSTGNLAFVGQWAREQYSDTTLIFAVDNDIGSFITVKGKRVENPGKYYAEQAAINIDAAVALPPGNTKSDWCDWHLQQIKPEEMPDL